MKFESLFVLVIVVVVVFVTLSCYVCVFGVFLKSNKTHFMDESITICLCKRNLIRTPISNSIKGFELAVPTVIAAQQLEQLFTNNFQTVHTRIISNEGTSIFSGS